MVRTGRQGQRTTRTVIAEIQRRGATTLAAIAAELEARGVRTPAGRSSWAPAQVSRLEPGGRPPVNHVGDGWPLLERVSKHESGTAIAARCRLVADHDSVPHPPSREQSRR